MVRRTRLAGPALVAAMLVSGCGSDTSGIDPRPEKLEGSASLDFERDDLEAAASASGAVEKYCADAVSEAQRIGCVAHVTEEDLP